MKYTYYVDKSEKIEARHVFVTIWDAPANPGLVLTYCPIGQHGEASLWYVNECKTISKKQYIEASRGFYTPEEYLQKGGENK